MALNNWSHATEILHGETWDRLFEPAFSGAAIIWDACR